MMQPETFATNLLAWYDQNKRDLPWRGIQNPYFIWISEVILQQTRVNQGMPYYLRFVEKYPTVADMAAATEKDVLRLWQGLGYYSRARNMLHTAQIIVNEHDGKFPDNYKALKKLKGIGDYTASAIASFAFNEKVATVDGNVFRVLARIFGVEEDIASLKGKKTFAALAKTLLPDEQTANYNQAVMEFGALYCKPASPDCPNCIFKADCVAANSNKQDILPIKAKKNVVKKRYFHYLVFEYEKKLLLKERGEGDIWQGLYDFVLVERTKETAIANIAKTLEVESNENEEESTQENTGFDLLQALDYQLQKMPLQGSLVLNEQAVLIENNGEVIANFLFVKESPTYIHQLTHQTIYVQFSYLRIADLALAEKIKELAKGDFYDLEAIQALPKPILVENYLKTV
jgi:A/G-specific adenine glycosylase